MGIGHRKRYDNKRYRDIKLSGHHVRLPPSPGSKTYSHSVPELDLFLLVRVVFVFWSILVAKSLFWVAVGDQDGRGDGGLQFADAGGRV
ncbi:hypothetical protein BHE74_00031181 [Ensete ventricosum]|nr:hypothetical protein BHE74_00031181 [Ensete ventricosum]